MPQPPNKTSARPSTKMRGSGMANARKQPAAAEEGDIDFEGRGEETEGRRGSQMQKVCNFLAPA